MQPYVDTQPGVGAVFPVSWDAALALKAVGARFFLIVRGDEKNGQVLEEVLRNLITSTGLPYFIAVVEVEDRSAPASHLGVVSVPQVRLYSNGRELKRHHGAATRDTLADIFGFGGNE